MNTESPVRGLRKGDGYEVGAHFELGPVRLTTPYRWPELDSELKFVGDSNSVEPGAATKSRGYELVGFWRTLEWLALDAAWTGSRARYDAPLTARTWRARSRTPASWACR